MKNNPCLDHLCKEDREEYLEIIDKISENDMTDDISFLAREIHLMKGNIDKAQRNHANLRQSKQENQRHKQRSQNKSFRVHSLPPFRFIKRYLMSISKPGTICSVPADTDNSTTPLFIITHFYMIATPFPIFQAKKHPEGQYTLSKHKNSPCAQ